MLVSHRSATSNAAAARGSSSRVRPFSAAVTRSSKAQQKQQRRLVAKAAEEEQQPEPEIEEVVPEQAIAAEDFQFNYSEAKKVRTFSHFGRAAAAAHLGQCCPTARQQHMAAAGSGCIWDWFSKQHITEGAAYTLL
jgi:hypothetical protein